MISAVCCRAPAPPQVEIRQAWQSPRQQDHTDSGSSLLCPRWRCVCRYATPTAGLTACGLTLSDARCVPSGSRPGGPPRICILGGGFGGLYAAIRLENLLWPNNKRPQASPACLSVPASVCWPRARFGSAASSLCPSLPRPATSSSVCSFCTFCSLQLSLLPATPCLPCSC